MCALASDDLSTAEGRFHRAAELSRQLGHHLASLRILYNLSALYRDRGQFDLARDAAIEALWPEKSPAAMQTPFHQATSALCHALEPALPDKFHSCYLEVGGGQITLCLPPGSWVDWEALQVALYQGMQDFLRNVSPVYLFSVCLWFPRQPHEPMVVGKR
jgi:hypothetical protein